MTAKLLTSALFAGLVAGLIAVLLQLTLVEPLILEGEAYETGAKVHFAGVAEADHDHATHDHGAAPGDMVEAEPENLTGRFSLAFFTDFVIFVGWGLILVAGFALAEHFGQRVTLKNGLLWGGAGFIAVHLAPGIGLAPELPGTAAADLAARQIWWLATVLSTAAALGCFAFGRNLLTTIAGVALLIAPHVIGAPHLDGYFGVAPPELSGEYVARSLAVSMAAWVVLGLAAGYFWNRQPDAAAT